MMKALLFFCLFTFCQILQAQNYTISGFVQDSISGETLINATVINGLTQKGISTNEYGFFSISANTNNILLEISYVGYQKQSISFVKLKSDTNINVHLSPDTKLDEVIVFGEKNENLRSSQVSMAKIDVKKVAFLPVLAGETDLVKSIQLLPGVQSGTEGTGGMQIRGGSQGDNLVLLDGAPVYNVNHLWGFFSVFNTSAIQNVELYKGGFPARYGGRLSSVLDIRMKEGNNKNLEGNGSVGLISSKFTLQGPLIKDKTSFIVSARRTYFDLLLKPLTNDFGYYFYDANAKINHRFSPKSRLFLSFYTGKDDMYLNMSEEFLGSEDIDRSDKIFTKMGWGNITSSTRWNYTFNNKLFLNSSLIYSRYQTNINSKIESNIYDNQEIIDGQTKSNLKNNSLLLDFSYFPNASHSVKFGGSYTYFAYLPLSSHEVKWENNTQIRDTVFGNNNVYSHEFHAYVEDDIDLSLKLKTNIGLHASSYFVKGKWYKSLEPRFALRYLAKPNLSFKLAYSEMNQYVFQYPNIFEVFRKGNMLTIHANPEVWLPATNKMPPQKSRQWVVGSFLTTQKGFNLSIEAYYKNLSNVIKTKENTYSNEQINNWEDLFVLGKAKSYGLEFMLEKKTGNTTGWIAYTLSKTERQFEGINKGKAFPYTFDRRHNLNIVINKKFSDRFDLSAVWVFGSGRHITLPDGQYISNFNFNSGTNISNKNDIPVQSSINAYKMPAYNRLDVGMNFHKQKKWGKRTWSLGVYNTYNYHNSFLLYVDYDQIKNVQNTDEKVLKSVSLFPIIPYVSYSFKF